MNNIYNFAKNCDILTNRMRFSMRNCGMIFLFLSMLLSGNVQAQTPWLDSLYVRVADAKVERPAGNDAVVVFDIEVFRPVREWNNNDTTLGSSDFVFGKSEKDLTEVFKSVQVSALHPQINGSSLSLMGRFVLGRVQISLAKLGGSSELKLPYREWVKLCQVRLPLKNPATVELGLVWDRTATGLITARNIPILEDLKEDLNKIPDKILNFEDYASSQTVCPGEEFFLFAHAVSSGEALSCSWHYSRDKGATYGPLDGNASDWQNVTGQPFQYRLSGEYADTLWLRGIPADMSGVTFKCEAEDVTVMTDKRETPGMVIKVLPEVKVALEGYDSKGEFESNLGVSGDTARHCPGEKARARVAFYDIANVSQLDDLKNMGGSVHIAYRWINRLGGDGRDTLTVELAALGLKATPWNGGHVYSSDRLELGLPEDGKYYIYRVWTDSCSLGTVLTEYDTVVVKANTSVEYEFDPIDYVSGSGAINVAVGLGIDFKIGDVELKDPAIGTLAGLDYVAGEGKVGTDTLLYTYHSGGCTVTASRIVRILSGKHVAIKVLLEGPYSTKADSMYCIYESDFPILSDKYVSPYSDGKEWTKPFPAFDRRVVDWIYVEIWDYPPHGMGNGDTRRGVLVDSTSALLLSDGMVAGLDGKKYLTFNHLKNNDYYVLVKHRNHLPVLSAKSVTFTAGTIGAANTIDFSQKMENAFDIEGNVSKQKPLKNVSGKCVMYGGHINGSGRITVNDLKKVLLNMSKAGYLNEDINFDGRITVTDQKLVNTNLSIYIKY